MATKNFRELHYRSEIFYIGNVWDTQSALMMEKSGYKSIATSSSAIATSLGYQDGEEMDFEELYKICKQIVSKVKIPLSVDIEGGYSRDSQTIVKNIISLYKIGVVGINIEDSVVTNSERKIQPKEEFSKLLKTITTSLKNENIDIFINVRTDNFIMQMDNPLENTLQRIKLYEKNGADGIFVPCIIDRDDIKKVVKSTSLPINVLAIPNLPKLNQLQNDGVKRISQGDTIYNSLTQYFNDKLITIKNENSNQGLFL